VEELCIRAHPKILLVSHSMNLAAAIEASLLSSKFRVCRAESAEAALDAMLGIDLPWLVLLDAETPGMPLHQLLAAIHAADEERRFAVVLIAEEEFPGWQELVYQQVIDDLLPKHISPFHLRARLEMVLQTFRKMRDVAELQASTALNHDFDVVTGLYHRAGLLSMLFRETDRVQRMKTPLSVMRFDIGDCEDRQVRLGRESWENILKQAVERVQRLLRTYDLFGRLGSGGFVLGLPGCTPVNAACLAERIRDDVFQISFRAGKAAARLTACFGIAPSHGRSPLIVLRDAEQAVEAAETAGPGEIRSVPNEAGERAPAAFLSTGDMADRLTR
jgi:two-component system cell cycle response regulator